MCKRVKVFVSRSTFEPSSSGGVYKIIYKAGITTIDSEPRRKMSGLPFSAERCEMREKREKESLSLAAARSGSRALMQSALFGATGSLLLRFIVRLKTWTPRRRFQLIKPFNFPIPGFFTPDKASAHSYRANVP